MADKLKLSFKAVSNHLAVLRAADVVEREQIGLTMNYRLASPRHALVKASLVERRWMTPSCSIPLFYRMRE